tara:strand:+ start:397 stop:561 length:165 start_codon:yes stop_codon:yes gene_type:complete
MARATISSLLKQNNNLQEQVDSLQKQLDEFKSRMYAMVIGIAVACILLSLPVYF